MNAEDLAAKTDRVLDVAFPLAVLTCLVMALVIMVGVIVGVVLALLGTGPLMCEAPK